MVTVTRRAVLLSAAVGVAIACGGRRGPRDIGNLHPSSEFPAGAEPRDAGPLPDSGVQLAAPTVAGTRPQKLARATSRAIALDRDRIYFGDAEDDGLYAMARTGATGGTPTKLARRAPMQEALAIDPAAGALVWIGTPGDIVLKMPVAGGAAATVREHGLFTGVVASGADVFYVEAEGTGGFLSRNTTRLGSFEGSPRSLTRSGDRFFVATSSRLVALRERGEAQNLASGAAFAHVAAEGDWVYATTPDPAGRSRIVVRVPASGGALEAIAAGVRDAPIAVFRGTVYWFDAERPAVLATEAGRPPRTISEDDLIAQPSAIAVDGEGVFLAAGVGEDGQIIVVPFAPRRDGGT